MELEADIDADWNSFCEYDTNAFNNNNINDKHDKHDKHDKPDKKSACKTVDTPKCNELYISTKTMISYLSSPIDLKTVFWEIPIIPYHQQTEGVIKKQMKFNSPSQIEVDIIMKKTEKYLYTDSYEIKRIVNPTGRIKFKDVRKLSIGLCKKDITNYKCKQKEAFYNCFVVELRLFDKEINSFKEIHVKVFNTGKLEIPGIKTDKTLISVLELLTKTMRPLTEPTLSYNHINQTVLINSNFNCGYFINREKLYEILKYKYKINSAYDPCSYPGIQCKFYYNPKLEIQTGRQPFASVDECEMKNITKVTFMIFRTGSVLIVGKCVEFVLKETYKFLKNLFEIVFNDVGGEIITKQMFDSKTNTKKKQKIRKKTIIFEESS